MNWKVFFGTIGILLSCVITVFVLTFACVYIQETFSRNVASLIFISGIILFIATVVGTLEVKY